MAADDHGQDDLMPIEGAGDVDAGLRELLAAPVELPPLSATATAINELEHASVGAIRVLKQVMAHGTDDRVRVSAARAILDAALRRWSGEVRGDPLGDLVAAVVEPDGGR
jgi:hypothetical protein